MQQPPASPWKTDPVTWRPPPCHTHIHLTAGTPRKQCPMVNMGLFLVRELADLVSEFKFNFTSEKLCDFEQIT